MSSTMPDDEKYSEMYPDRYEVSSSPVDPKELEDD